MEEMAFVKRNGIRRCLTIVLCAVVAVLLIYYVIERRLNLTVADYYLPKKNLKTDDNNSELEMIKMKEEERILNANVRTTTAKAELSTVKLDPTLYENEQREPADDRKEFKEKPTYILKPSNVTRNNILWVYSDGALTLENRIVNYLRKIESLRTSILSSRTQQNWTDLHDTIDVLWCNQDDFLRSLQKYDHVKTIALSWHPWKIDSSMKWTSLGDVSNLLIQKYYHWSAAERLCQMIRVPGYTKARWYAVYRQQCSTDPGLTANAQSIDFVYFWGKPINKDHYWPNDGYRYPGYFYEAGPMFIFYMHIVEDVVVTALGDIISAGLKLVPYSCSQDLDPKPPPNYRSQQLHDEVFIMGQYWGEHFFHKMLENVPRLIPYLQFLRNHPTIKIHTAEIGGYTSFLLELFGLDPDRLIKGVVRANVVFMPQATPCGFPHVQSTQIFSHRLRTEIRKIYPKVERNNVVLIHRSSTRRFTKAQEIQRDLEQLALRYNRTFHVFTDSPTPSPRESMRIFNEAVLVVGPHGAGLSNLLYCEPGTFVIEGVCNPPHVNMCYQRTAHILGHHYHAVDSSSGCESVINVEPSEIIKVADIYLTIASTKQNGK